MKENRARKVEEEQNDLQNKFDMEFDNIAFEGREVPAQELAERLEYKSKVLLSWLGKGVKAKQFLKDNYEKYRGGDDRMYIRKISKTGALDLE